MSCDATGRRFRGAPIDSGGAVALPFAARGPSGDARPALAGTANGAAVRGRLAGYGARTHLGLRRELRAAR